jgi:ABC-type multidrug transport system permease subunit
LCDRVAIIVGGRIVALDTAEGLRKRAGGGARLEVTAADAQGHTHFIRFPMMFLGGVFVSVDSMPAALQWLAWALPLTYAVDALRGALDGAPWTAAATDLAVLLAFAGVLFALSVRILVRRLA